MPLADQDQSVQIIRHILTREEVWLRAWIAVAGTEEAKAPLTAECWADDCLRAFDRKFLPKEKP